MPVNKPSICFWKQVISIKWTNKLLIHNTNLTGHRRSAWCLRLLVFLEIWPCNDISLLRFGIGGPRFFLRIAATMISKRFVKLGIKVHFWILYKIWSKDDSYIICVYYLPILWKGLEEREVETKNARINFSISPYCALLFSRK